MKYLLFADLHSFTPNYLDLITEDFDVILFLGDIKASSFLVIRQYFPDKDAYAVLGNHDDKDLIRSVNKQIEMHNRIGLKMNPINDVHLQSAKYKNDTFTGFQGCVGYKQDGVMMTQDEALYLSIPAADILISHESGYHYVDPVIDQCHEGFLAIAEYITKQRPKYNLFGHHHKNIQFQKQDTMCYCIYGCSIFDSETGFIQNIFVE